MQTFKYGAANAFGIGRRLRSKLDSRLRLCLGEGVNGMGRNIRKEVEAYEATRQV